MSSGDYKCYLSADLKYDSNEVDFLQIQELLESLEPFLKRIIVGKHSVMCTDLILKKINLNYFEKIDEMNLLIKRIIHEKNSKENLELIYLFLIDLQEKEFSSEISRIFDKKILYLIKKFCFTSSSQLINSSKTNYGSITKDFILPANNDHEITWSNKDNIEYSSYFEVYHKEIGTKEFESEDKIKSKIIDYIIGNEIDPITIYINDNYCFNEKIQRKKFKTYIETTEMKKLLNDITKASLKKDFFVNNKLVKTIQYSPYCGGTTTGRVLLYKLKNKLPCFRLKFLDNNNLVLEGFKTISMKSDLPIVVLIDTDCKNENQNNFTQIDAEKLSRRLSIYDSIRHFIIFIDRDINSKNQLTDVEINEYKNFYKFYLEKDFPNSFKTREKNLITIRLLYLEKEIRDEEIKEIACNYLKIFNENERNLLILMLFFDTFTLNSEYFDADMIAFILRIEHGKKVLKNSLKILC